MSYTAKRLLLTGNHAVAWAVKRVRPHVAPLYPITPQTPILEKLTDFQSKGELEGTELLTPESEHSAMAACISASLTGVRVFTATSSQGLLLMHELLHYAAGARARIVLFNVNRTPASPWGFWPDQLDSLSQRDTGWVQLYSESPQESLDTTIQAYRIAELIGVPIMISHDAFYVSHAMEPVEVPSQQQVDEFLPPFACDHFLDPKRGQSFGAPLDQQNWNRSRREMAAAMARVFAAVTDAGKKWGETSGRDYAPLECYRMDGATTVIVTMGSMCGTAREAVDALQDKGNRVGLLKVRLFRPFPVAALKEALAGVSCAIVLDRNFSCGLGGILHQELKAALYGLKPAPKIHGLLSGVGGVNVSVNKIKQWVSEYAGAVPVNESLWVE